MLKSHLMAVLLLTLCFCAEVQAAMTAREYLSRKGFTDEEIEETIIIVDGQERIWKEKRQEIETRHMLRLIGKSPEVAKEMSKHYRAYASRDGEPARPRVAPAVVQPTSWSAETQIAKTSKPLPKPNKPIPYYDTIASAAAYHEVPIKRSVATTWVESDFNPRAVSCANAKGLKQLIPSTAREMGVKNVFDPVDNEYGGNRYLRQNYDLFKDWDLASAAYYAGPKSVIQAGYRIPYKAIGYVQKIKKAEKELDLILPD